MKYLVFGIFLLAWAGSVTVADATVIDEDNFHSVIGYCSLLKERTAANAYLFTYDTPVGKNINVAQAVLLREKAAYGKRNGSRNRYSIGAFLPNKQKNEYFLLAQPWFYVKYFFLADNQSAQISTVIDTPEPGAMIPFATGLIGIVGVTRRKSSNNYHSES